MLSACSLRLDPGDLAVVRGASGSGKTTLLLVAGGMLHPRGGSTNVDGRDGTVGFIFQTLELLPYLDVQENIRVGLTNRSRPEDIDRLLEELGLTERARHRPHQLSIGECQRVATARALVGRPTLVLADEPTGNLDERNASIVLTALARHAREGGAVLLATHGPIDALEANRLFEIDSGTLRELEGVAG